MERELWASLSRMITQLDRQLPKGRRTHSVGRIVRIYLWAVLHDRPVYWACRRGHWAGVRRPVQIPDQSTMSRRLQQADTREFLDQLAKRLAGSDRPQLLKIVDGMPLTISRHSQDSEATFGRGAGGLNKGYKLHAIYGQSVMPLAWQVHPMNLDERHGAAELLGQLKDEGYLLADRNYDANWFYDAAAQHGQQLLAARRYGPGRGLGHHRHSSARLRSIELLEGPSDFGRTLYQRRRQIETRFGNLCSFGGGLTHLPPWVRGLQRVRLYVAAKLIITAAKHNAQESRVA
jgi:IS5 family transposase